MVCNAAGYSTNAVAELAFGLAISALRNIPACDNVTRIEGTKAGLVGTELYNKTFGVVGTGAIGTKVALIAQAFGCNVIAYSRTEREKCKTSWYQICIFGRIIKTERYCITSCTFLIMKQKN